MSDLTPRNLAFDAVVREMFAAQPFLAHIGAELVTVDPGYVEIALALSPPITQQQGFLHGGAVATLADVAGGFAALSLMAVDHDVLTVEFKLNLLRPGKAPRYAVRGEVVRAGRTLTICQSDVYGVAENGGEELIATALGTFFSVARKSD